MSIENKTGSYATTGSNIFQGTQIITGSLFISQDLIIAGSSSIQNISSSVLNISDNIITVNAVNPSVRFGGLAVIDSGSSPQVSGSMLYDSVKDEFLFVHQNQGIITSSVLLMGPETFNNVGNEAYITQNRLTKGSGVEHLNDSNITDTGTKVSINSNTEITGSLTVAGGNKLTVNATGGDEGGEILLGKATTNTTLVGEGVTIDIWQNRLRFFEQGGNARGAYLDISTLANGVGTNLLGTAATASYVEYSNVANKPSLVSGSSQITFLSIGSIPPGLVSGSSQVLVGSGIWSGSSQLPSGVVSGSAQLPSGLVSGSSQVLAGTTIHSGSFFNGITVVSGSGQISFNGITDKPALVSGSGQISFNGITDKPTLVSGSSQITFGSISSIPGGIVSGSVQVDLTATTNYSSGIKTRLNAEGVLSGSAQVVASLPNGTVSGSAQITLSNTTGYGSVINQAVLTTSSPTFAGITNNGTYTQATTSTQPLTINGDSGDTNGLFRIQMDSVSDSFASGARTYLGDGGIDIFLGTSNSSYTPSNTYIALNHSGEISMGAGSATKHFTLSTSGNLTISGNIGASNLSGTNTGDQTLNSLGALSSSADSEQVVGVKDLYFNFGVGRVHSDPRWNESGYDADLGTLHIYSTTAAGANYGRAGIALYNGLAYQYITTKASTTGVFINNTQVVTNTGTWGISITGNSATATILQTARTIGGVSFNGSANIDLPGVNSSGNQNTSGTASNITAYTINQNVGTSNTVQFSSVGVGVSPAVTLHARGSGEMVRFENTSTGANEYTQLNFKAGSRNGYIWLGNQNTSSWAGDGGLNIYTDFGNMDLWSNAVQRVRLQSDGHLRPFANNTYDLGTASFGWRNVYTNDLHLSNMNKPEGNDVDGTNGNWTIQEGAENLYIINNNNGKKFKISLEEII